MGFMDETDFRDNRKVRVEFREDKVFLQGGLWEVSSET